MARQWPEVFHCPVTRPLHSRPTEAEDHAADEWWDPAIGQTLDLRQVQPLVLKRTAGEFPGLCKPQTRLVRQRPQHRSHNRRATVTLQLDHGLTGKARPFGEAQHQRLIQKLSAPG